MRKPHRRGAMAMEKPSTSSKCRTQFWYIAVASFLLWIFLLYLFNSSAATVRSHERLFREDATDFTVSEPESDPVPVVSRENPPEQNDNSTVENTKVSGETGKDQTSEDAEVVNDIVEELEKEKAEDEKKGSDSVSRGTNQAGDRDSAVAKERESRKTRSWDRLESERKRASDDDQENREDTNDSDGNVAAEGKQTRKGSVNRSFHKAIDEEQSFFDTNNEMELQKDRSDNVLEEAETSMEQQNDQPDEVSKPERVSESKNDFGRQKTRSERVYESKSSSELGKDGSENMSEPKYDGRPRKNRVEIASAAKNSSKSRNPRPKRAPNVMVRPRTTRPNDPCAGKYVYIHEIPELFNEELLKNCWTLSRWTDMCGLTSNLGLGPRLPNMEGVSGWFATNQFTLEVIFHNRMKQYGCLTKDSSLASAIFVPYYSGLDVMRFLWGPFPYMRDAAALDLMKWLRERPEWRRMDGRDHFMIAGRTTWDFMRTPENESDWGNRLMILPEPRNMTMLLIESSPWNYHGFAIPYPTYFHPSTDAEILQWQNRMRRIKRRYLFSFVGAPRPNLGDSIRTEIMDQCKASRRKCKLLECVSGSQKCYKPDQIMKFFLSSTFCLQPPGDSYTRRSTFDSILAGCIPVFFHPGSAYAQYIWHLPKDREKYSVFIPANEVKGGKVSIERALSKVPRAKVVAMREEVIKLIPRVMYFDPSSKRVGGFEDAFDVAVKGVLERVEGIRGKMEEGAEEIFDFPEEFSWKYNVFGHVEKHEWDSYFDRP
ncbi:PREDICTED: probable xyloglucan galactosyltransferase GT11 [Tarenaya hassleriana]|uniref:probable xyloglucan galactosyltransferase GT11 n=1 Tax=Tarenaya hassleriana TaxID=28532 RepID=UPI00053C2F78|nr:PREDICTED: probable xyloglucan galactosyltransferase GT11 [Tarenaya hassleriana]XP_010521852.1 PREDICTED: probable xyloglucan galactosyltransferase GT11 [Tarenaya hassleriana]